MAAKNGELSLSDIKKMVDTLDAADIPIGSRKMRYINEQGELIERNIDTGEEKVLDY
jgi:hypothetical protein